MTIHGNTQGELIDLDQVDALASAAQESEAAMAAAGRGGGAYYAAYRRAQVAQNVMSAELTPSVVLALLSRVRETTEQYDALVGMLRLAARTGVNPVKVHDEPVRFGTLLPECAGGLAYFICEPRLPVARTFDDALNAAIAEYRAAPSPTGSER